MTWTNAHGPVNLLGVQQVHFDGNHWVGNVGNQKIHIPSIDEAAEKLFLQFTPRDVTLSNSEVSGLSSRNHLNGTIRQIVPMPDRQFIAIDIGQIIWAEVTAQAVEELNLRAGNSIICLIKSQSIEVLN